MVQGWIFFGGEKHNILDAVKGTQNSSYFTSKPSGMRALGGVLSPLLEWLEERQYHQREPAFSYFKKKKKRKGEKRSLMTIYLKFQRI